MAAYALATARRHALPRVPAGAMPCRRALGVFASLSQTFYPGVVAWQCRSWSSGPRLQHLATVSSPWQIDASLWIYMNEEVLEGFNVNRSSGHSGPRFPAHQPPASLVPDLVAGTLLRLFACRNW